MYCHSWPFARTIIEDMCTNLRKQVVSSVAKASPNVRRRRKRAFRPHRRQVRTYEDEENEPFVRTAGKPERTKMNKVSISSAPQASPNVRRRRKRAFRLHRRQVRTYEVEEIQQIFPTTKKLEKVNKFGCNNLSIML